MLAFTGAISELPVSFLHHHQSLSLCEPSFSASSVSYSVQRGGVSKVAARRPIAAGFAFASACALIPVHCQQRRLRTSRRPRAIARVQVHAASADEQDQGTTPDSSKQSATYVKVWVTQVCWLGPGALVALDAVYGTSDSPLPRRLLAFLDAEQADEFQRAAINQLEGEGFGDDAICEVRVHNQPNLSNITESGMSELFGELVLRQDCPVNWGAGNGDQDAVDAQLQFSSDVLGVQERRLRCSVGEALATSQQLKVPALVCVTFLIRAAKNCIDKALLEGTFCRGSEGDDDGCDLALYELRYDLNSWLEDTAVSGVDAHSGGVLLHKIDAFAWQRLSQHTA